MKGFSLRSSGHEDGREWAATGWVWEGPDEWFPQPKRTESLSRLSPRLGKYLTRHFGRCFTVRLRNHGLIGICDWTDGQCDWFSWNTDESEHSEDNRRYLANAIKTIERYDMEAETDDPEGGVGP